MAGLEKEVNRLFRRGLTPAEVKDSLVSRGFKKSDINRELRKAKQEKKSTAPFFLIFFVFVFF